MKPTERQVDVLLWVANYIRDNEYPPSYREACDALGMSSTGGMMKHVAALHRKGLLHYPPTRRTRSLRLTDAGKAVVAEARAKAAA